MLFKIYLNTFRIVMTRVLEAVKGRYALEMSSIDPKSTFDFLGASILVLKVRKLLPSDGDLEWSNRPTVASLY
jgi:hypothetical protein